VFPAFILGVALLAGMLLAGRWYAMADTKTLLKMLKWVLLGTVVSVVFFFIISGRLAWALAALPALLPWFFRLRAVARAAKTFARMRQAYGTGPGAPGTGGSSDLETRFLRMWLDHETGAMSGEVINGPYKGRHLDDMGVPDLVDLWQQCDRDDPESGRVVAAYLDRAHPDWREGEEGVSEDGGSATPFGVMDRAQALQVLGLAEGATAADVKDAHRRLIAGMHPDHGGSDFLAAQINQAKDVLLGDQDGRN
jgi:hypothetical protein